MTDEEKEAIKAVIVLVNTIGKGKNIQNMSDIMVTCPLTLTINRNTPEKIVFDVDEFGNIQGAKLEE